MYGFDDYGRMIADRARMDPYAFALREAITPSSTVLDIGTGAGIHALLACKFGARRVFAVEPDDIIHLAQELAEANGFAGRIEFFQDHSTNITLPEQADVIVSDLRGVLPLFGQHIPSIVDARKRHLAPSGVLIPRRDTLWVSLVESRSVYHHLVKPWDRPYGLNMEAARQIALNRWTQDDTDLFNSANLLTEAQVWATLDYRSIEDPYVAGSTGIQPAKRDGTAHGWLTWFDAELADSIGFSNGPDEERPTDVYGRAFFPLFEPVNIAKGDGVSLVMRADLVGDHYVWRWHTRIHSRDDPMVIKADFWQCTDFGFAPVPCKNSMRTGRTRNESVWV